jgi:hypothetical protein
MSPTHPKPAEFRVDNRGSLSIVALTMTGETRNACRRCSLCTAVLDPEVADRFVCANVIQSADVDDFLFGPLPDSPALSVTPKKKPARSTRRRRVDSRAVDDVARSVVVALRGVQEADETEVATGVDDDDAFSEACDKVTEAAERAASVAATICDDLDAVAIVAEDHLLVVVAADLAERVQADGHVVIPIPKAAIVKARRPR